MLTSTFITNARAMVENNMAFFSRKSDSGRKLRSKEVVRYFKKISRNQNGQAVIEWEVPSSSDPSKSYDCYISVEPKHGSLFVIASSGGKVKDKMQLIRDADVRCFCTCPDFNWSGMKYNMKHRYGGYEEGHTSENGVPDGSDIRPRVRDPRGKNTVCKHLLSCFNGIMLSAGSIMKATREAKFPKEYTQEPEQTELLNRGREPEHGGGKILPMNRETDREGTTGEIKMANTEEKKPLMDYPTEDDAIKLLGESAPTKIPEAQEALDALAETLGGQPDTEPGGGGEVEIMNSDGDKPDEGGEIKMFNSGEDFDPITGIEDAAGLPMFNPEDDDEEKT